MSGSPTQVPNAGAACPGGICDGNGQCITSSVCGNGIIEAGEQCDDGDTVSGDGCSATCQVEPGWTCVGEPSVCSRCGNGIIEGVEQCDGTDLGGQTCTSLGQGFSGGTLACSNTCQFDTSGCT